MKYSALFQLCLLLGAMAMLVVFVLAPIGQRLCAVLDGGMR